MPRLNSLTGWAFFGFGLRTFKLSENAKADIIRIYHHGAAHAEPPQLLHILISIAAEDFSRPFVYCGYYERAFKDLLLS